MAVAVERATPCVVQSCGIDGADVGSKHGIDPFVALGFIDHATERIPVVRVPDDKHRIVCCGVTGIFAPFAVAQSRETTALVVAEHGHPLSGRGYEPARSVGGSGGYQRSGSGSGGRVVGIEHLCACQSVEVFGNGRQAVFDITGMFGLFGKQVVVRRVHAARLSVVGPLI